jgi:hypothetical protein
MSLLSLSTGGHFDEMPKNIEKIWSEETAEQWFKKIEESNGKNETEVIDWKETLYLKDTGFNDNNDTNNTTQRAMSGFANTLGGVLVLGFNRIGKLVGIKDKDVDNKISTSFNNRKNTNLNKIKYQVRYYTYKGEDVVVIFVDKSKEPIQCDNGTFYYREQSQFLAFPYFRLENKFREYLDEEKYLYLLGQELERSETYINSIIVSSGNTVLYNYVKIDHYSVYLNLSGEKLYYFYKQNNLLGTYSILIKNVAVLIAKQDRTPISIAELGTLLQHITDFSKLIKNKLEN